MSRSEIVRVAALGGGVIGASWTALFLAAGKSVAVYDPDPAAPDRIRKAVEAARPVLGFTDPAGELHFFDDPRDAIEGAEFVQESVPERIAIKREVYAAIEPALGGSTVVASSASGLTLTELRAGWRDPSRLVLGHPFNPPHLIPLVEVMGDAHAVAYARSFYESIGKVTIELKREVPGHAANRLQAALWREAIHLVTEGVASVEDVDKAVAFGPGLRWAAMGPTMLFHLGAGEGGLAEFCERYRDTFHGWWDDLGTARLDPPTVDRLVAGLEGASVDDLSARRDALIAAYLGVRSSTAD